MRAAILVRAEPSNTLKFVEDYSKPKADAQNVLLRVKAFAISQADLMSRRGVTEGPKFTPPKVIGSECVGVIEEISPDLQIDRAGQDAAGPSRYKVGDVVIALMGGMGRVFDGCYADYVSLPPSCLSPPVQSITPSASPDTFALLAAIPGAFLAAYGVLVHCLHVNHDDTLLVHGGSSSVGMAIASLSKHLQSAKKVVGTTRDPKKVESMKNGGFDGVIVLPPEATAGLAPAELARRIKKEGTELEGFTAQVDLLGADHIPVSLACAKSPGHSRVCMAGMLAGGYFFTGNFSPMGIPIGVSLCGYSSSFKDHLLPLPKMIAAALEGKLKVAIDKTFLFREVMRAHEYCDSSATCGKVVCVVD